ncbi:hypothetical protein [Actinoplanes aureus]|uniref:Uncharacterized protein n=1 Tax=Actinoplanes aureus TaxID=2792083 RepID=A0A931FVK2_9ACTN|nr:hypothetical protein [Actinoplanes aureus]MBG0560340.1 hypothetical protein [Actinoplanes aureus]
MTAPGDIVILLVLLASVLACAGYAAGRLHQRRQSGADREEAYRHGFDSGTRSVFGMAARAAGRRRDRGAVHGAAGVPPAGPPDEPTVPVPPQATAPSASPVMPASAESEEPTRPVPQGAPGFPAPPPQAVPEVPPPAATGGVTYTSVPDPRWPGDAEPVPEQREPEPRRGRHTVPEELVQAATYVLPPDRVARAKVVRRPEDPPGPHVPRPRGT